MSDIGNKHKPYGPYERFFKRPLDFILAFVALIILLPLLSVLTVVGAIAMRGNPFFTQLRPGKIGKDGKEKIFKLIKFRTMSNAKDSKGNLLPDEIRLNKYGKFLRSTSLDELPELINIIKGDMAIVGPRPLLLDYLPWYTEEQRQRHMIRPGLTGYSQAHGRNSVDWDKKFEMDIDYCNHVSFSNDLSIVLLTIKTVLVHEGITSSTSATMDDFRDYCKQKGRIPRY